MATIQEYIELLDLVDKGNNKGFKDNLTIAVMDNDIDIPSFKILITYAKTLGYETIEPKKRAFAFTYEQLLTLPWYIGAEDGKEFTHLLQPGYDNINGDKGYFGTSKEGKRIISVNADYVGHTYVLIEEDGGTRKVFNGHVRSFEELKLINSLVL